jgi:hypothetical protein
MRRCERAIAWRPREQRVRRGNSSAGAKAPSMSRSPNVSLALGWSVEDRASVVSETTLPHLPPTGGSSDDLGCRFLVSRCGCRQHCPSPASVQTYGGNPASLECSAQPGPQPTETLPIASPPGALCTMIVRPGRRGGAIPAQAYALDLCIEKASSDQRRRGWASCDRWALIHRTLGGQMAIFSNALSMLKMLVEPDAVTTANALVWA